MQVRTRGALAGAVLVLSALAFAGVSTDQFVAGKKLLIKDNLNSAKRKAVLLLKDPTFNPGDPTVDGVEVQLVNPSNDAICNQDSWFLPPSGWTAKNGTFKYKDKDLVNGPVKSAKLKAGFAKFVAKGSGLHFPLLHNGPQGSVGAVLHLNGGRACLLFPGALGVLKKDDSAKGAFIATKAEAPSQCPLLPDACEF